MTRDPVLKITAKFLIPLIMLFAIVLLAALVGNLLLGGVNVSSEAMIARRSFEQSPKRWTAF